MLLSPREAMGLAGELTSSHSQRQFVLVCSWLGTKYSRIARNELKIPLDTPGISAFIPVLPAAIGTAGVVIRRFSRAGNHRAQLV